MSNSTNVTSPSTAGSTRHASTLLVLVAAWVAFAFAVFVPDVGRGFVKDDFAWITVGRAALLQPETILRPSQPGFFRPLVTASFAASYRWFGLKARDYGFTNLALYALCVIAIVFLIRQFGLPWPAAAVGAFAWAINPHGIGMAVLWISGRTSLLLTLSAVLSAIAFFRGQRFLGLLFFACALGAKEEAVVLPIVVAGLLIARGANGRRVVLDVATMSAVLAGYFVLRLNTPSLTFATAPWFYRPTADAALIARNVFEYLDRGATIGVIVALMAFMVFRRVPSLSNEQRRAICAGGLWFVFGFVPTVWIPVRSSLYAVFPSVGMAIAVGVVVDACRRSDLTARRDLTLAVALSSVVLFSPIYRARNASWVEAARVSNRMMRVIVADVDGRYSHGRIVLEDEHTRISNFRDAFGGLATEAVQLVTNQPLEAAVLVRGADAPFEVPANDRIAWYRLENGTVRRLE